MVQTTPNKSENRKLKGVTENCGVKKRDEIGSSKIEKKSNSKKKVSVIINTELIFLKFLKKFKSISSVIFLLFL